ncbi:MAG: hypothetical protein K0U37_01560 [Gammaproteobacteria bacterium]|nr:hypothetical protein [Gammaproteobacteria bacterium]
MGTLYLEGRISESSNIDTKLGAWEVLRDFDNAFKNESLSGVTITAETLGSTFYMKLNIPGDADKHNPTTILKVNKIFDGLKRDSDFEMLQLLEETPELKELFESVERAEASTVEERVLDDDLDSTAKLTEGVVPTEKIPSPVTVTSALPNDKEEKEQSASFTPRHTVYLKCKVDSTRDDINAKLGAWEVMQQLNNAFGDVSGTTITSRKSDDVFFIAIDIAEEQNLGDDYINENLNRILTDLDNNPKFQAAERLIEKPSLERLFENIKEAEGTELTSSVENEDLGTTIALQQGPMSKAEHQRASPTGVAHDLENDGSADSTFNPRHQ